MRIRPLAFAALMLTTAPVVPKLFAAPKAAFGTIMRDRQGEAVGYLRLDSLPSGAFTGRLEIERKFYRLRGSFDAKGRFRGNAVDEDGDILFASLQINQDGKTATLAAEFGGGEFEAVQAPQALTDAGLASLKGRYTIELPPATTTTTEDGTNSTETTSSLPAGHGWMSVKIDREGHARIKGKTGDGRGFFSEGVLGGSDDAPLLPVFISPDGAVLTGTLTFSKTISGDLAWMRESSRASYYPDGFETTVSVNGSRYEPPGKAEHALSTDSESGRTGSLTISDGKVPGFTRDLRFSRRDNVRIVNRGLDHLSVEIDRKSGTFKGKFRILNDLNRRLKFSGVLLQHEGRGSGVFLGVNKSGSVELKATSGPTTTMDNTRDDDTETSGED